MTPFLKGAAKILDPEAWDEEEIAAADYPVAKRRIAKRQEASIETAKKVIEYIIYNMSDEMIEAGAQVHDHYARPGTIGHANAKRNSGSILHRMLRIAIEEEAQDVGGKQPEIE